MEWIGDWFNSLGIHSYGLDVYQGVVKKWQFPRVMECSDTYGLKLSHR